MTTFVLLVLLGLGIGSFLNVLILRYNDQKSLFSLAPLRGRSHCPHCKKQLAWYELIPLVSFIIQGGRCRTCKKRISFQYPVVELLTAAIFVLVPMVEAKPPPLLVAAWIFVFIILLVITVIDIRKQIIPDEANILLALTGIGIAAMQSSSFLGPYAYLFGFYEYPFLGSITMGILGILSFGAIVLVTRGKGMGMGDVKLAGALGIIFGWPDGIAVFFLSFIIGALVAIPFLLAKKIVIRGHIPFGPFLALAAVTIFFFGENILSWYFQLFNLL